MVKPISFHSYKLNKEKYNTIESYAILVRNNKNELSKYTYDNCILDLFHDTLTKYDFINKTKHLRNNIGGTTYQQLQYDVYTKYKNSIDKLDFKIKNTKLSITIKYLVKSYKNNKEILIDYLKKSNKDYHKYILEHINKFGDRLFNLVIQKQLNLLRKIKLIDFKSLTFNDINQLSNKQSMIELSDLKLSNAVINLNIPKVEKIIIPTRYSKKYHGNINSYKHSYNKTTKQNRYSYNLKFDDLNKRIKITLYIEKSENEVDLEIDNENIIGIDVNTKNNLFSLSDGNFIKYDMWLMNRYRRYEKYISRIQKNKDKRGLDKKYGKKVMKRVSKMNKISKYYNDLKSRELVNYCIKNEIKHVVMEDLILKNNKTRAKNNNINYNNIIKILHLNDYKNVIKRIANKHDIIVSYTNPRYTSQTCSKCGYISKKNRKTQETFSCVECNYTLNADMNAAINIKNRIYINKLRNKLQVYDSKINGYKGKDYINKDIYINIYKNL